MQIYDKVDFNQKAIDQVRPFEGHFLKQIKDYYRVDLTWASNSLEGNSLTISETKVIIEDGLTIGGKPLREIYEVSGHAEAYDFMFSMINDDVITQSDVMSMHRMFYRKIDEQYAGRYRDVPVTITGSEYPVCRTDQIQDEMDELFAWIKTSRSEYHPIEFAALLHKRFVFIHPFIDGNGRIARLLMNVALLQDGYIMAVIKPDQRQDYIDRLELAHSNDTPFLKFIGERVYDTQKQIMELLQIPEWNNYDKSGGSYD